MTVVRQGVGMHFAGELTPEQFWAVVDDVDEQIRRTFAERPVYAVRGWPGRTILSEWALGDGGIRSLSSFRRGSRARMSRVHTPAPESACSPTSRSRSAWSPDGE